MRIAPWLCAFVSLALPAAALDLSDNFQPLGLFSITLDGAPAEFTAVLDTSDGSSNVRLGAPMGVRTLWVSGAGAAEDGVPAKPYLSLVFQAGLISPQLKLQSVDLYDQGYTDPLHAGGGFGTLALEALEVTEDGAVSFHFAADLQRIDLSGGSEVLVEGAPGVHIAGSFTGRIADGN